MLLPTILRLPLRFYTHALFAVLFGAVTVRAVMVGQPILALCTVFATGAAIAEAGGLFRKTRRHLRTRSFVAPRK
jgi:hypothetical protein